MNHPVLLVPHQEIYLQSWRNFPEIRWHMLVTGFGGGKTRANVILTLMLVRELQGLKDRAGDFARIICAGYTLSHLSKTFILYLTSYLNSSKTEYRYDTKNNIMYIGTVTIIFLPMDQPDNLFGEDCVACFDKLTKVLTRRQKRNILEVCIENVKEGDEVLTRQGWKKVLAVHDNGWKDCINVRGTWCTPDHKFATGDEWIEAKDITDSTPLYKYSLSEVKAWQNVILGRNLLLQMSRSWMESGTIDTRILPQAINAIITGAKSIRHITWLCGKRPTESCLKDIAYTIRTSTALITASTICSCLQSLSTTASTLRDSKSRDSIGLRKEEESCLDMLRSLLLNEDVRKFVPGAENSIQETSNPYTVLKCAEMLPAEIDRKLRELNASSSECVNTAEKSTELSAPGPDSAVRCVMMLTNMPTDLPLLRKERQEFVLSAERSSSAQEELPHRHALPTARTSREVRRCHVYDLTVEDCHEYFADRRLVHNCIQEESDELPEATLIEACKALSERTRQQIIGFRSPFICLGTTSQGESGLYRLYCQFKKKGTGFVLIRGRTQDNFYLPKEQIIDLYKMYDDTERRVFLEGEFLAVSRNRVFPGFDWARNYMDDDFDKYLKPGERVFIGMDFNGSYNRASAWVAREGVMHCVKSYDFPDASDSPDIFRYDFPDQDIYWIPDVTTKDSYPQYARALRKNNIHIIHRSKNPLVEDTAFLVSVLCKNSRIVFHKMAREAADSIARAVRDKDGKIGKGKAPSDWQHYADGVRYACSYMALVLPDFRDIRQSLITHIASLRREVEKDETPPVRKLAAGYTQIDPAAFFKK